MDAAGGQPAAGRGAPRLLDDYTAVERLARAGNPSARARVESELGGELARLLLRALTAGAGRRTAVL